MNPLTYEMHCRLIDTARKKVPATMYFPNVNVLHVYSGIVQRENVWLCGDRIAYVGQDEPLISEKTEVCRLKDHQIMVPAYIEPHAHPFLLYNPLTLGSYLTEKGTMISVNDNSLFMAHFNEKELNAFVHALNQTGLHTWLWWAYFEEGNPAEIDTLSGWLNNPLVMQGGELSHWLPLKFGSPDLYEKLFAVRHSEKRMESHLPGSSVNTLNLFAAGGVSADHESMTAADVINRLNLGYYTAIRYSSIRPDLPVIMNELAIQPGLDLSKIMLTNDGASLPFLKQATHAVMIKQVMDCGISMPDAYRMATLNPAVYYRMDDTVGSLAPGRIADINILESLEKPEPTSVLFEGKWFVRDEDKVMQPSAFSLEHYSNRADLTHLPDACPLQQTTSVGIELQNSVITRPYSFAPDSELAENECLLTYICRSNGMYLNTRIKNFSHALHALGSTYCASGDILLIGQDKQAMANAYQKILDGFQGITAQFDETRAFSIGLDMLGVMSNKSIDALSLEAEQFMDHMKKSGFAFDDPFFCLFFLTELHLPYVRLTPEGIIDIKSAKIIAPTR
ncbi:adenine deaminase C-terminal domain-containing protein [Sporolactobacillus laevolacticus]|uniref:adenine deaminase C-terminal domain-containing protein n=1 Tax=Sporolactobacillus laevolacticus TaxID=33018 RepID=UPI0025B3C827|nr:adenine deaminase C-terminal domain-containing protein [Sporolactobacillus laevolacticus]MDN3955173.1 adenine deaminase C-terminal domain-containing protein [Sporolactobacillus laevolacticus]